MTSKVAPEQPVETDVVLKPYERLRLALESNCTEKTIRKWERGDKVTSATQRRLEQAAERCRIPVPSKAIKSR
jgi:hypothetical protein